MVRPRFSSNRRSTRSPRLESFALAGCVTHGTGRLGRRLRRGETTLFRGVFLSGDRVESALVENSLGLIPAALTGPERHPCPTTGAIFRLPYCMWPQRVMKMYQGRQIKHARTPWGAQQWHPNPQRKPKSFSFRCFRRNLTSRSISFGCCPHLLPPGHPDKLLVLLNLADVRLQPRNFAKPPPEVTR